MKNVYIFLLAIFVIAVAGCTEKPEDKAKQFIEAGMYGDAIPLLEEELQNNPKNTVAHYLLGMAFLNLGEEEGANQSFNRAIRLDEKKYIKRASEAYHKTGLSFLGQDTPAGVRRGLRYLDRALDKDGSLKSEIVRAFRDRGVALVKTDKALSYTLLTRASELDPNLKRDNDFYYALFIEGVKDPELQNKACEDFLSLFPGSKHVEDVLYLMGNYQYSLANYKKAKQYFGQLGQRYPDSELGMKAKVMVDNITKIEQEIGQAELQRAKKTKQLEIEKAEQLKQMEIERAERLQQIELEAKKAQQELELRLAERKKQTELARQEEELKREALGEVGYVVEGTWDVTTRSKWTWTGYFELRVVGNKIVGREVLTKPEHHQFGISGTLNGTTIRITRNEGLIVTYEGVVDVTARKMSGKTNPGGYNWYATKR